MVAKGVATASKQRTYGRNKFGRGALLRLMLRPLGVTGTHSLLKY